ncbi:hypothetical protein Tco_0651222 [Tanacetum coccineum]
MFANLVNFLDIEPLPAADLRHPWLRYQIEEYNEGVRHSYKQRLETIWGRPVNRIHILHFAGLTPEMRQDLAVRLGMVYSREGQHVFVSHAWRRLFEIRSPLVREFILEFLSTCRTSDTMMDLDTADTLCFQLGGVMRRMTWRQFILALGLHTEQEMAEAGFGAYWAGSPTPSYVLIRDHVRRLCHRMIAYSIFGRGQAPEKVTGVDLFYLCSMDRGTINVPHLLAHYLFRHAEGRKSGTGLSRGHFIRRLAKHFRLVSDEGLRGLQVAAASALEADEAGQTAEEVALKILAPAPAQAPPPAPQPHTMSQRIERLEEEVHDLRRDVVGLRGGPFDSTLVGSSGLSFRRRVRPRTGDASTSAAPHTDAQPDP